MRKIAHYYYPDGNEIQVYQDEEDHEVKIILDGNNQIPKFKMGRHSDPSNEWYVGIPGYEELAMYYGYSLEFGGFGDD